MARNREIRLASPDDVPGIVSLQERNLRDNGGSLSVRQPAAWFERAIAEKSLVVCRRTGEVRGYVSGTSLAAQAHVPIVQAMLRAFPAPPRCYLYGPVCVADSERGTGLAGAMFVELHAHKDRRPAITFVRADNVASRKAHAKMGMKELGGFECGSETYIALYYPG